MRINSKPDDRVSAADRGLQYGDGLFETLAVSDGSPQLWQRHMRRLTEGCARLGIACPCLGQLSDECREEIGDRRRGVLKLILTRGVGGRGYAPPAAGAPTRIVAWYPAPDYPRQWWQHGVRVRFCSTRLGENPLLAGIKHLNRLEQVLARSEWSQGEIVEGLMLDQAGHVIEGTQSNVFVLKDEVLLTPALDRCGVAGVMREEVIAAARRLGMEFRVRCLTPSEVASADAMFLTNALLGMLPVREIDGLDLDVSAIPVKLRAALTGVGLYGEADAESSPVPPGQGEAGG